MRREHRYILGDRCRLEHRAYVVFCRCRCDCWCRCHRLDCLINILVSRVVKWTLVEVCQQDGWQPFDATRQIQTYKSGRVPCSCWGDRPRDERCCRGNTSAVVASIAKDVLTVRGRTGLHRIRLAFTNGWRWCRTREGGYKAAVSLAF